MRSPSKNDAEKKESQRLTDAKILIGNLENKLERNEKILGNPNIKHKSKSKS